MADTSEGDPRALKELRSRIDAIDAEMHRLLIERGSVIESLIRTKGTSRPGAAFRPGREADMMRRLVARHSGALPLATVEHIWREIITTFTRMQAPFDVVVDLSVEPEKMRDLARFVFGFSVRLTTVRDPAAVIEAVAKANDLGFIARAAKGAWWRKLGGPSAPRIMAYVPFIRAEERPVDLPAFVISPPLSDPTPPDIGVFAVTAREPLQSVLGIEVLAAAGDDLLIAAPGTLAAEELPRYMKDHGVTVDSVAQVGGFARGVALGGLWSVLYARVPPS
ncbi:MAG: chorismate mutase [Bauldia sp.]|nr:chorismate mutase [Bauldia sp.]